MDKTIFRFSSVNVPERTVKKFTASIVSLNFRKNIMRNLTQVHPSGLYYKNLCADREQGRKETDFKLEQPECSQLIIAEFSKVTLNDKDNSFSGRSLGSCLMS